MLSTILARLGRAALAPVVFLALLALLAAPAGAAPAAQQAPAASGDAAWAEGFGFPGVVGQVNAIAVSGADVYVGGEFTLGDNAAIRNLARWDGAAWHAVGADLGGKVTALAISGATLYAAGELRSFSAGVARWDGQSWRGIGGLGTTEALQYFRVNALAFFQDSLYVGGVFYSAGGARANNIARYDGVRWHTLGSGVDQPLWSPRTYDVTALAVHDGSLYVGGAFDSAGGVAGTANIARWDGAAWHAVGGGAEGMVLSLASTGGGLVAGGYFKSAGGAPNTSRVARWDGAAWHSLGGGVPAAADDNLSRVAALAAIGGDIYLGGFFAIVDGQTTMLHIARWDGAHWQALGGGVGCCETTIRVLALAAQGTSLLAGGHFPGDGDVPLQSLGRWDGAAWHLVGAGSGLSGAANALLAAGDSLYAGGEFTYAGALRVNHVARWDGARWQALGAGVNGAVTALAVVGEALYVAGEFTSAGGVPGTARLARWEGGAWHAVAPDGVAPTGPDGIVKDIIAFKGDLIICGGFGRINGAPFGKIARWDGAAWHALGQGVSARDGWPNALAATATDLYVGGSFSNIDGKAVSGMARWDGAAWHGLGGGLRFGGFVDMIDTIEPRGPDLFVAGHLSTPQDIFANRVMRWDGAAWQDLPGDLRLSVNALRAVGGDLYAAGQFESAGGQAARNIAVWDGTYWYRIGGGLDSAARALEVYEGDLIVGGDFTRAGAASSFHLARLRPGLAPRLRPALWLPLALR